MPKPSSAHDDLAEFRNELEASAEHAERALRRHPKGCKGCAECPMVGQWGTLLHLAAVRVAARKLDTLFGIQS